VFKQDGMAAVVRRKLLDIAVLLYESWRGAAAALPTRERYDRRGHL